MCKGLAGENKFSARFSLPFGELMGGDGVCRAVVWGMGLGTNPNLTATHTDMLFLVG